MSKGRWEISTKTDCWFAWYAHITDKKIIWKEKRILRRKKLFFWKYRPFPSSKKCIIVSRWHFIPRKNVDGKKEIWVVGIFFCCKTQAWITKQLKTCLEKHNSRVEQQYSFSLPVPGTHDRFQVGEKGFLLNQKDTLNVSSVLIPLVPVPLTPGVLCVFSTARFTCSIDFGLWVCVSYGLCTLWRSCWSSTQFSYV